MQFVTGLWRCRRTKVGASPSEMTNTIASVKHRRHIIIAGADSARLPPPTSIALPAHWAIACK